MTTTDDDRSRSACASPPGMAHDVDLTLFDPQAHDPQQARDVAQWRRAESDLRFWPADLSPRPVAIGTGLQSARLATIFPQPHDIALSAMVAEAGVQIEAPL